MTDYRELARDDAKRHHEFGTDRNPFSTDGARFLWQAGFHGIRPPNLVDGSGLWCLWERGRYARIVKDMELPTFCALYISAA